MATQVSLYWNSVLHHIISLTHDPLVYSTLRNEFKWIWQNHGFIKEKKIVHKTGQWACMLEWVGPIDQLVSILCENCQKVQFQSSHKPLQCQPRSHASTFPAKSQVKGDAHLAGRQSIVEISICHVGWQRVWPMAGDGAVTSDYDREEISAGD